MCNLDEIERRSLIKELITKIVKEEYGGCDPSVDNPCILKAVVSDGKEGYGANIIYVWVVGKWRSVGRTNISQGKLPSPNAVMDAIIRIRRETGKTFEGKGIMLEFIKFGVSADTLKEEVNYGKERSND